jgi:RHH-type transcriptional regulator, rel operon repressor / antitoxin RelB
MSHVSLSLRVPQEKAEELEPLAAATHRPTSALLEQALDDYLDLQRWQMAEIERGRQEVREGKGIPDEEIEAWLETMGSEDGVDPAR